MIALAYVEKSTKPIQGFFGPTLRRSFVHDATADSIMCASQSTVSGRSSAMLRSSPGSEPTS